MKLPLKRKISIDDKKASILIGMVAFVFSFLIQWLMVFEWGYFRNAGEEFQLMAMGAHASGYSWDDLVSDVPYGGIFYLPLLKILFGTGASGNAVYRVMRWVMAFINSVPAYLTARVAIGHYGLNKKISFALSLISVAACTVRAFAVRPDNLLVLFVWIAVYALIRYSFATKRIGRIIHSIVASLAMACMVLVDIKACTIVAAFLITALIFRARLKKWILDPIISLAALAAGIVTGSLIINRIVTDYSAGYEWHTSLYKIWGEYFYDIARGAQRFHMSHAVRGMIDVFLSNIWIIVIFSCGIIILGFTGVIGVLNAKKKRLPAVDGVIMLLGTALILTLIVYSISYIKTGILIHLHDESPNNTLFCLKYYGYLLSPLLVMEIIVLLKNGRENINTLISTIVVTVCSSLYVIVSVIIPAMENGYASMKWWFGYETPFLMLITQWAETGTGTWFFVIPSAIVIILLVSYHRSFRINTAVCLMLLVAVLQYGYIEYFWKNDTDHRGQFDSFIFIVNEGVLNTAQIDDVYYDGSTVEAYSIQMAMPDLKVHSGVPDKLSRNMLILSSDTSYSVYRRYHLAGGYRATYLDGNENIITNDDYIIGILRDNQFVYRADDRSSEYVTYLYQTIFGREPDPEGLNSWSYQLINGSVEPSDIILAFVRSEEFANKDYTHRQTVNIMSRAFWGRSADKVTIHELCDRLDHGENTDDIADYFMNSEAYASMLRGYRLHDNDADYVDSFIRRTYQTCMGRGVDESGLEFFGEQIRDGEMSPMELVNTLIASEEYTGRGYSTEHTVISIYILYTDTYPDINTVNAYAEQIDSGTMTYEDLEGRLEGTIAYREMIRDYNLDEYI